MDAQNLKGDTLSSMWYVSNKARNSRGNTGLHFLFAYGYADIAEYFIEKAHFVVAGVPGYGSLIFVARARVQLTPLLMRVAKQPERAFAEVMPSRF